MTSMCIRNYKRCDSYLNYLLGEKRVAQEIAMQKFSMGPNDPTVETKLQAIHEEMRASLINSLDVAIAKVEEEIEKI